MGTAWLPIRGMLTLSTTVQLTDNFHVCARDDGDNVVDMTIDESRQWVSSN
jgi:hypothetical protein